MTPVDVVVPTLGRPTLAQAVRTALSQTLPAARVLVVDDSPAGVVGETLSQEFPRPVEVVRGPRRGAGAARNAGLRAARAPLVAFLDDDDLWGPRRLEVTVRALEGHPGAALAACDARVPGGGRYSERFPLPREGPVRRPLAALVAAGSFVCTSAVTARTDAVLAAGGFAEDLPQAEDYALWLALAARGGGMVRAADVEVVYRPGPGSVGADRLEGTRFTLAALDRAFPPGGSAAAWLRLALRRRRASLLAEEARLLLLAGQPAPAVLAARRAVAMWPGPRAIRGLVGAWFAGPQGG